MQTIAIISQKGGAGKTTIAIHLAVEAQRRGLSTAIFDLDPQGSAVSWADRRAEKTPAVVAAQVPRLPILLEQAKTQKADLIIIDSAPNADNASLAAAKAADLILIPCRPAAFDLGAINTTLELAKFTGKPAWVVLNAVPPQGKVGEEARQLLIGNKVQVVDIMIHHLVAFSHAVNDGRTAQEYEPKSKAALEVSRLFEWVKSKTSLRTKPQTRKHANA